METEDLRSQLAAEREQNAQMTAVMEEYSTEITKLMESKAAESENAEVKTPAIVGSALRLVLPKTMRATIAATWVFDLSPRSGRFVAPAHSLAPAALLLPSLRHRPPNSSLRRTR